MKIVFRHRPGTTLVELLIFLGIISVVIGSTMPLLFSAMENRLLQQTISVVEQNGTQVVQNITLRVHHSERILDPLPGETGSVLALQTGSGGTNPTIIGVSSGSLFIVEHATRERVSSPQVGVSNLVVRNTSTSASRQSVELSFTLSRTIRLQQPRSYVQKFHALVALFPDDITTGSACNCASPSCEGPNIYGWHVCQNQQCLAASTSFECASE